MFNKFIPIKYIPTFFATERISHNFDLITVGTNTFYLEQNYFIITVVL